MFSFDGYKPVDLSPRLKARIYRVDGSLEDGNTDPNGKPWVMKEGRFPGDNSLFTLYAAPVGGDEAWHQERMTTTSRCPRPGWCRSYQSLGWCTGRYEGYLGNAARDLYGRSSGLQFERSHTSSH